jgi:exosome complex component RRP45
LCVVSGEIVQVVSDQSHDGFINFYVHISPMAREDAEVSNATNSNCFQQASKIAYTVESILRCSRALDTEGLYIEADSKLWSLTINIHVLNDDGNLIDACGLAALAGLLHFRRDKVNILFYVILVLFITEFHHIEGL